jgi:hypothetical protein
MTAPPRHHDPTWPYEDVEAHDVVDSDPSWACAAGICVCHAAPAGAAAPERFSVLLCDERSAHMPGARCRVLANGILLNEGSPNADGGGRIALEASRLPAQVLVEWAPADTPSQPELPFRKLYYVDLAPGDRQEAARRRLHNLGYSARESLEENITDFQDAYHLGAGGRLDDVEATLVAFHDQGRVPPRGTTGGGLSLVAATSAPSSGGVASAPVGPAPAPAGSRAGAAAPEAKTWILIVRWLNPSSPWLSSGKDAVQIKLTGPNGAIDPIDPAERGRRRFRLDVPTNPAAGYAVELDARFQPSFGDRTWQKEHDDGAKRDDHGKLPALTPPAAFKAAVNPVFVVTQRFELDRQSDELVPMTSPRDPVFKLREAKKLAPVDRSRLIHLSLERSGNQLTTTVTLQTQFVDVTEHFRFYGDGVTAFEDHHADEVKAGWLDGAAWRNVRVLGFTGSGVEAPPIWFYHAPEAARGQSTPDCQLIMLCRHELAPGPYAAQDGKINWQAESVTAHNFFGQYLFVDQDDSIVKKTTDRQGKPLTDAQRKTLPLDDAYYVYQDPGFGKAIKSSGKRVAVLCPIPNSSMRTFGGRDPKELLERAVALLWTNGHLAAASVAPASLERLAVAAWSEGGLALWGSLFPRLQKSTGGDTWNQLDAIYAFDPNATETATTGVVDWLTKHPSTAFFLTVGQNMVFGKGFALDVLFQKLDAAGLPETRAFISPSKDEGEGFWLRGGGPASTRRGALPNPAWITNVESDGDDRPKQLAMLPQNRKPNLLKGDSRNTDEKKARHGFARSGSPFSNSKSSRAADFVSHLLHFLRSTGRFT